MTTPAAEKFYLAQHEYAMKDRRYVVVNPLNKPVPELPVIYGFNNGGTAGWLDAVLMSEDGQFLGSHICSAEGYMLSDLGILEGTRDDRHAVFAKHYPKGYRMEFVGYDSIRSHAGLNEALRLHDLRVNQKSTEEES